MRLFTAIPLSIEIKRKLQKLQKPIAGIRWQPTDQMHITLRFLGETSQETAEKLKEQFKQIQVSPFSLKVSGLGTFPKKETPQIIWVGIEKSKPLMQLQDMLEQLSIKNWFKPDKRDFIPHITLGKLKSGSPKEVIKWIEQHKNWGEEKINVLQFSLFVSKQQTGGITHEIIESYRLAY